MREYMKKMRFKNIQAAKLTAQWLIPNRSAMIDIRHNKKHEEKDEG